MAAEHYHFEMISKRDKIESRVKVTIDAEAIAEYYTSRARHNKTKKTKLLRGCVIVEIVPSLVINSP